MPPPSRPQGATSLTSLRNAWSMLPPRMMNRRQLFSTSVAVHAAMASNAAVYGLLRTLIIFRQGQHENLRKLLNMNMLMGMP